jgi:hypothetical protein
MKSMLKVIWKYPLDVVDEQDIFMPGGAKPLCVQLQHGKPCLWALVDPSRAEVARTVFIFGTGNPAPVAGVTNYVGTFQQADGRLVWHVFIN